MTLKEAYDAGQRGVPVVYDGLRFRRITRAGYRFAENGVTRGYVEIADYPTGKVVTAPVEAVSVFGPGGSVAGEEEQHDD